MKNTFLNSNQRIKSNLKVIKQAALFLLIAATIAFCGCSSFKRGTVYKDWTKTLAELGIFPVFPPREDVQVGDVWLLPMHPFQTDTIEEIGGLGLTGIWCDNILTPGGTATETRKYVSNFYMARPSFPSTMNASASILYNMENGSSTAASDILKICAVPRNTDTANIFTDSKDMCRLRQVAFPEFAFTKIDKGALNALVPVEYVLNVAGGFTYDKIRQISLKITSAESYGCPASILLKKFFENGSIEDSNSSNPKYFFLKNWSGISTDTNNDDENIPGVRGLSSLTVRLARAQFNDACNKLVRNGNFKFSDKIKKELKKNEDYIWLAVINEVYYARAMDINISTRKGWGSGINVQPITNKVLEELDRLKNITLSKKITKNVINGEVERIEDIKSVNSNGTTTSGNIKDTKGIEGIESGYSNGTSTGENRKDTGGRDIVKTIEKTNDVFSLAKKINDYNANLGKQLVPGGSINVVSASESFIGLRRIFDRPIAVGVRGVIMRINVNESNKNGLYIDLCNE